MLEFICNIPEELGWTIVGIALATTAFMAIKLATLCIKAWKMRQEEKMED